MRLARLLCSIAVGALLLTGSTVANGSSSASLSLYISFFTNGTISVTLPDGTALGVTSGTPPVIPAGYYTLVFSGPGGCYALPYFHLTGPGTNVVTNMAEGTSTKATNTANLLPSSTYTWSSDAAPNVVHTFATSAVVEGSPPTPSTSGSGGGTTGKGVTYPDIVGSEIAPFRGTLTAAISASGRLSLAFKGKSVTKLRAGKYSLAVTDRSSTLGFLLRKGDRAPLAITGSGFVGTRSKSVRLTAGRWLFAAGPGKTAYSVVVA